MKRFSQQFLLIYCAVLSTVLAVVTLTGASTQRNQSFDEIQVASHQHCRTEWNPEDGISNQNRLQGVIIKGKEQPPDDRPRRE
jgi:hypothetical protein